MRTMTTEVQRFMGMLHLASPQLPVGGYSYSQGLEAAINAGLVSDAASAQAWIGDHFEASIATWELPTLALLLTASDQGDRACLSVLNDEFIASRETRELREETLQMGWSLNSLLSSLRAALADAGSPAATAMQVLGDLRLVSFPCAFAVAARAFGLDPAATLSAYAFAWVENQVAAAIKAVPLGQVAGQRILLAMHPLLERGVTVALGLSAQERQSFVPGLAILSARHEAQYSRLFRS